MNTGKNNLSTGIKIVECPRDAMQGWPHFIPTQKKIDYINTLLQVGFDTIDFGSFVSSKAIPQMADTKEVVRQLDLSETNTKLLAIVANIRGAEEACAFEQISFLGFPFSISETFQQRNTNSSIAESLNTVEAIQQLCIKANKELVIYLSMGFGNPYGDEYNEAILINWAEAMVQQGVSIISLADTVGVATPEQIKFALNTLIPTYPKTTIGVHLHCTPDNWKEKLGAAVDAGCKRIDGALKGIGGCPMAGNALVGNMNTENVIEYLDEHGLEPKIDRGALEKSQRMADQLFF
jgi:hydroxymethylglutaryl-CoA lyase